MLLSGEWEKEAFSKLLRLVMTQLAPQLGTFYVELIKHLIGEFDGQIVVNSVAVMQCTSGLNPQSLSLSPTNVDFLSLQGSLVLYLEYSRR